MDDSVAAIVAGLRERFPEACGEPVEERGEVSIDVDRAHLTSVARALQEDFEFLADWSCVDYLGVQPAERRFMCAGHLASFRHRARLRLRVWIPDGDERCSSLVGVWPTADFHEREMFDLFGIRFEGHPDLRRIVMPDEWEGHPQRKDYPLGGHSTPYRHGAFIPPADVRQQPSTTTGYPGRIS